MSSDSQPAWRETGRVRMRLTVQGAVQGVGFRPFVYHLASELSLQGWVSNTSAGVLIEVEGRRPELEVFLARLQLEKPPQSILREVQRQWLPPCGYEGFVIRPSEPAAQPRTLVLPDLATCPECMREVFDSGNRRFRYPFTNCTHCGPRFTIVESLPYDRAHTSMKGFAMCPACQAEYEDPADRRFHAQPNACPVCGPRLELWGNDGERLAAEHAALETAAAAIADGRIVAVKGLGGFHLMVAAHRADSIGRLRHLKRREAKPFALMFPSLDAVERECVMSTLEQQLLCSVQAPIVLLRRAASPGQSAISPLVAPGNPYLGLMLPSTPLHHLLMRRLGFPVVATSGNQAEEPICIDEREALERLAGLADLFLVHNRPIVRHADDSIVRVMAGGSMVLRRARGYAPLPVTVACGREPTPASPENRLPTVLAVGAHLKNSVALAVGEESFISQHIGDLETLEARAAFERVIADFQRFYGVEPDLIAADAHPDYWSSRFATGLRLPVFEVQHHYAHILSCMAEHGLSQDLLGVSWDGTGLGSDGTIWGGEFLQIRPHHFERFAHWRTFRLPGGERAIVEPRRAALGVLFEIFGDAVFQMSELAPVQALSRELGVLRAMLNRPLNSPLTSSVGRLFDATAAVLGLRQLCSFEGQAAMELEFAIDARTPNEGTYPFALRGGETAQAPRIVDWEPMITGILADLRAHLPAGLIAQKLHNSLAEAIVQVATQAGHRDVVLSGGCFQNKVLLEKAVLRLRQAGFSPHWHRLIPPNDGGIALGQVLAARRARASSRAGSLWANALR